MTVNEAVIELRKAKEERATARAVLLEVHRQHEVASQQEEAASKRFHAAVSNLMQAVTGDVGHIIFVQDGHGPTAQTD